MGDERGVAARLEALKLSHRQGMEEVKRMMAAVVRGAAVSTTTHAIPGIEVTAPASPSFAAVTRGGGAEGARGRAAQVQGQAGQGQGQVGAPSFFNRERQEGGLQAGQGRQPLRQDRSSSASKRLRTGEVGDREWQEQRHRRGGGRQQQRPRPTVIKGTSDQFAELAGPVNFWVGKCRPDLD